MNCGRMPGGSVVSGVSQPVQMGANRTAASASFRDLIACLDYWGRIGGRISIRQVGSTRKDSQSSTANGQRPNAPWRRDEPRVSIVATLLQPLNEWIPNYALTLTSSPLR